MDVQIAGDKAVMRALNELPDKVYRKHVGRVLKQEAKPLIKTIRELIRPHDETGAWRKSIASKVKKYVRDAVILCTVGSRYKRAPHEHLVEKGHKLVRGGQDVGTVEGLHLIEQAYEQMGRSMLGDMQRKILSSVYKEAAKQAAKNRA